MGVRGLGYSDAIEAWIANLIFIFIFLRKDFSGSEIYKLKFNWKKIKEIFTKGSAIALSMLIELGPIFGMSLMAGHYSSVALASQNVTVQYNNITYLPILTGNLVANQSVGRYRGAKFYKNTRRMGYYVIAYSTVISSSIALLVLGARRQIVSAFVHIDTPDRDAVIALSERLLSITAVTQALDSVRIVTTGALQGIKDVNYPLINSFVTLNCIALPLSGLLCFTMDLGAEGIAYGHGLAILVSAASLLFRWSKKTTISVLEQDVRKEEQSQKTNETSDSASASSSLSIFSSGEIGTDEERQAFLKSQSAQTDMTSSMVAPEMLSVSFSSFWGCCKRRANTVREAQNVSIDRDEETDQAISSSCIIL